MATIKDIADRAGVSNGLVSRVLSNDKTLSMGDEKRERIINVARELGYKKKKLATRKKIAICNWCTIDKEIIDPYYYYIREAAIKQLELMNVEYVNYFANDEIDFITEFDGIIAIGKFDQLTIDNMQNYTNNIVFIDSNPDHSKYNCVIIDFEEVISNIIEKFTNKNCTEIGFLGGCEYLKNGSEIENLRKNYFIYLLKVKKLYNPEYFKTGEFTIESGYNMAEELLKTGRIPKVIFCGNDQIAIGALRAFVENGFDIPNELEIIGFNNLPISKYTNPSLTTVEVYMQQMGVEGARLVIENIESNSLPKKILLPAKIIYRESFQEQNSNSN